MVAGDVVDQCATHSVPPLVAESRAQQFFEELCAVFNQAEQSAGALEQHYVVGGHTVHLRFAGAALIARMAPAFSHLPTHRTDQLALTVYLWDSLSTGVRMPSPPWGTEAYLARGEIQGYNDGDLMTVFQVGVDSLSMLSMGRNTAIFWVRDASEVPAYETAAPLKAILNRWLADHSMQLVHAAAVGTPEGGVLIVGKGGSGKSTTALACLDAGLLYAGDDYVLLGEEPTSYVYSLYSSAKLRPEHVSRLPTLHNLFKGAPYTYDDKAVLFLNESMPGAIATGFPLRAILVPRVTGLPESRLTPLSRAESLGALAPSTILQLPGARQAALRRLTRVAAEVPGYLLEAGTDLQQLAEVVRTLLRDYASPGR